MKDEPVTSACTIDGPHLGQSAICEPILRALPDWFGIESAIKDYVRDIETMPTYLARHEEETIGFVTIKRHFPGAAEVHVMGVLSEHHRSGVGRALLARAERDLVADGVEFLQVKTLSPGRENEDYAKTRGFYLAMGFQPLEEFPTLWDPANPCLLLVKRLQP